MRRVALVTGGSSGMGRATAAAMAVSGFSVAVTGIDGAAVLSATRELQGDGHFGSQMDVADETSVAEGFRLIEQKLGPIAVLAHFAGVLGRVGKNRAALADLTCEEWEETFRVNARGAFLCVREMCRARRVTPVEHGRIILIGSSAAQMGTVNGSAAYGASKGAVLSLVKTAARECASLGMTVNAISPGSIDTPMLSAGMTPEQREQFSRAVPLGRVGRPEEVAAAALFLASPSAGYVTGACLDINGGLRMQ